MTGKQKKLSNYREHINFVTITIDGSTLCETRRWHNSTFAIDVIIIDNGHFTCVHIVRHKLGGILFAALTTENVQLTIVLGGIKKNKTTYY